MGDEDHMPGPSSTSPSRGSHTELNASLRQLEGKSYGAYHDIEGAWAFPNFTFILDRAQSDPFAAPSRCRVKECPGLLSRFLSACVHHPRRTPAL